MYDDPTIVAILGIAVLGPLAGLAWGFRATWRAWRRRTAYRRNATAFLAELKTDAAWAAVTGHYAYAGTDILQMLRDHSLLDQGGYDALIAEADERAEREAEADASDPPPSKHAFDKLVDDEIPF